MDAKIAIVGTHLIAAGMKVPQQDIHDFTNAMEFAQAAASYKYDSSVDIIAWYKFYVGVLTEIGFVIESIDWKDESTSSDDSSIPMECLVNLTKIALTMEGIDITLLTDTTKALVAGAKNSNSAPKTVTHVNDLYSRSVAKSGSKSFAAGMIQINSNGQAVGPFGVYKSNIVRETIEILWFLKETDNRESFKLGNYVLLLNRDIYAQVRYNIIGKLGAHGNAEITKLKLKF